MERKFITINGIVQGVGFRPFVYKIAILNNILGSVNNTSKGVYIDIEGEEENIKNFIYALKNNPPKLSYIESIKIENKHIKYFKEFKIIESKKEVGNTLISPDIALCKECISEIDDRFNYRRNDYPFINCTNCGPRFSIIKSLPYDREFTTMKKFEMCNECLKEYKNPLDRRFHAEPTCCSYCGPKVTLLNKEGKIIGENNEIEVLSDLIKKGYIVAVKGIGGYNLICNGKDYKAIEKLRKRKRRIKKPLALMMKNLEAVKKYCYVNKKEEEILDGNKKPILLLKKKGDKLPENIVFNNDKLGVLLPYSPIHYILFKYGLEIIVFTSGNISGFPMIYKDNEVIDKLKDIADYFLIHNREINLPVDDSVVEVIEEKERVIRGGRGYAPLSIKNKFSSKSTLALGSELKNTFSIKNEEYIFISPYIGNICSEEVFKNFEKNLNHIKNIYDIKVDRICYDMHPNYWSNKYIRNFHGEKIGVYHHHSHIASCMGENNLNEKVIGIAFDGTGYGDDGKVWGGEFLICDLKDFKRVSHIEYFKIPGGDYGIKYPWKIGVSLLNLFSNKKEICKDIFNNVSNENLNLIWNMVSNNFNSIDTSSIGRLFDGISSFLGFTGEITYEGEGGVYLENLGKSFLKRNKNYLGKYDYLIEENSGLYEIKIKKIVKGIVDDIKNKVSREEIAFKFHNTIISLTINMSIKLRQRYGINKIALSGGVFQNEILFKGIERELKYNDFLVFTHNKIPCNDSGISFGQLLIGENSI